MRELTLTVDDALWDELEAEGPTVAEAAARRLVRSRPAWERLEQGLASLNRPYSLADTHDDIYRRADEE